MSALLRTLVLTALAMACANRRTSMALRTRRGVRAIRRNAAGAVSNTRTNRRGTNGFGRNSTSITGGRTCLGTSVSTVGNLDFAAASASA